MANSIRVNADYGYQNSYPESWERLQQVNKVSEQLQSYWVGFITICAFIIATAMSVTDRDIFLEESLKLPVISVELPLWWFFFTSPILIFSLHVFLLVKYRSLLESLHWFRELAVKQNIDNNTGPRHPDQMEEHLSNTILMRSLNIRNRDLREHQFGEKPVREVFQSNSECHPDIFTNCDFPHSAR